MRSTLSCCSLDRLTIFGLPETLEDRVRAAAAASLTLLSADLSSLRTYGDTHGGVCRLREVLDANGIEVFDRIGITITDGRATTLAELDESLGFADVLGATWIQSRMPIDKPPNAEVHHPVFDVKLAELEAGISN